MRSLFRRGNLGNVVLALFIFGASLFGLYQTAGVLFSVVASRTIEVTQRTFDYSVPADEVVNAENVLSDINEYRISRNIPEVTESDFSCKLAEARLPAVSDLSVADKKNHIGFLATFNEMLQHEPEGYGVHIGENVAWRYPTSTETIQAWHNSTAGHREIMQDSIYTHACVFTDGIDVVAIFSSY